MENKGTIEHVKILERYDKNHPNYKKFHYLSGLNETMWRCFNYEEKALQRDNLSICKVLTMVSKEEKLAILCENCCNPKNFENYHIPILKEKFEENLKLILKEIEKYSQINKEVL